MYECNIRLRYIIHYDRVVVIVLEMVVVQLISVRVSLSCNNSIDCNGKSSKTYGARID